MGSYTCPICDGSGTNKVVVVNIDTGKTEERKERCSRCNGKGEENTRGD